MKKLLGIVSLLFFSGCVTHYVVDGSVRLQLGNATKSCSLESFSVVDSKGNELTWISESVLPGESSKVKEKDFVGTFRVRLSYEKEGVLKDTVFKKHFDGGSVYLQVSEKDGTLQIKER